MRDRLTRPDIQLRSVHVRPAGPAGFHHGFHQLPTNSCVNASFRARTEVITPVDLNQLRYNVNRITLD